jgi:hypothetical protein
MRTGSSTKTWKSIEFERILRGRESHDDLIRHSIPKVHKEEICAGDS